MARNVGVERYCRIVGQNEIAEIEKWHDLGELESKGETSTFKILDEDEAR